MQVLLAFYMKSKIKWMHCVSPNQISFHNSNHITIFVLRYSTLSCKLCFVLWINSIHNFDHNNNKKCWKNFTDGIQYSSLSCIKANYIGGNLVNFFSISENLLDVNWNIFQQTFLSKTSEKNFIIFFRLPLFHC